MTGEEVTMDAKDEMECETKTAEASFVLSRVVSAHKGDVRGITTNPEGVLISGGRDDHVRLWARRGGEYSEVISFTADMMVTCVAFFAGVNSEWRIFAGRKDGSIAVFGSGDKKPLAVVHGHKHNVSCLYVDEETAELLSGGWDSHVIVWPILLIDKGEEKTLTGHTLSVWAVSTVPERRGFYLSGAADKEIFLWQDDKIVRKFKGHTDVVRALCVIPSSPFFFSAGNDARIFMWNVDNGDRLLECCAITDEYIYSLSFVSPFLVASEEAGHIEIWKLEESKADAKLRHFQLITSPAQTIWQNAVLSNGDIAAAASDGRIYVYTKDERRFADAALQESIDQEVSARVAAALAVKEKQNSEEVVIQVSLDDGTPNMELRYRKGDDPSVAAAQFLRDNNIPQTYLNEVTEYICANIPEARAAQQKNYRKQPTQRTIVDGEEWDFAFEATLDDGRTAMITYNVGEDHDVAAQRFVEKYNLPVKWLPKVANLLRDQTKQDPFTGKTASEYYDPFTGSGRYVPQTSNGVNSAGASDPFTGGGRYVPPTTTNTNGEFASGGDPFTSSGRYIPGSDSAAGWVPNSSRPHDRLRPLSALVPLKDYFTFGVEQVSQLALQKLQEANDAQEAFKLSEEQLNELKQLLRKPPSEFQADAFVATSLDVALQWSMEHLVPVLDLFRIALLHEHLNRYYCQGVRGAETRTRLMALLASEPIEPIRVLTCRAIANAFSHSFGRQMVSDDLNGLLPHVAREFVSGKNALQMASASALANIALLFLRRSEEEKVAELGPREDCLREILKHLEAIDSFGGRGDVALTRMLQALTTLMWGDSTVIQLAKNRNVVAVANRIKDAVTNEETKALARDLVDMTFAL